MIENIVDLSLYPVADPSRPAYAELVERARKELREEGVAVLKGFVRGAALERMRREALAHEGRDFHSAITGNAYLRDLNPALPADHAYNMTDETVLGVVAYDQIGRDEVVSRIYHAPEIMRFVEDAAGRGKIYHYECPLGKINYSLMRDGDYLRWHFDQSDFVVSIPIQDSEGGGKYEYVRNLRSAADENYPEVRKVLLGDRARVKFLDIPCGSLVLFEGRYTLHRVTRIEGGRTRAVALLGYVTAPGVTSTEYLRKIRYGRVG